MHTTLNEIMEHYPCRDILRELLCYLGKAEADDKPLAYTTILDGCGLEGAIGSLRTHKDKQLVVDFAIACACDVLHVYEREYPNDNRVRMTLEYASCGKYSPKAFDAATARDGNCFEYFAAEAADCAANAAASFSADYAAEDALLASRAAIVASGGEVDGVEREQQKQADHFKRVFGRTISKYRLMAVCEDYRNHDEICRLQREHEGLLKLSAKVGSLGVESGIVETSKDVGNKALEHKLYTDISKVVAKGSTCQRRAVGAIAVKNGQIVSYGYNGAPDKCGPCVNCERDSFGVPSGERLDLCRGVHAEQRMVCRAVNGKASLEGCVVYCTTKPCSTCVKLLIECGVGKIYYIYDYNDGLSSRLAREAGVHIIKTKELE